ncbi:IS701 family transposase (plasmid) [Streptomyces sp. NBC_01220]|uniref:IS701 family transposase n=1 Tax=Streptomyces sp. NBC_01220 TaxID=2903781 RepID=UPI002F91752A|nr:IS701 family transposase [Streptomyces sp. NBC_01220]
MDRVAGLFGRVEPRAIARACLLGLLSATERKKCWQLAEHAGHRRPGSMQRLLRSAGWDVAAARGEVRRYAVDHLGTRDGVLIVDGTGFLKKGRGSAGVQRQYTGTAGRIENSQVGVFLAYASRKGRALIDRRLYMPEHTWSRDAERCRRTGVAEDVVFATKPRLVLQMIAAALDAGVGSSWVTGDAAHGQDPGLRTGLEAREGWATCSRLLRLRGPVGALADRSRVREIPGVGHPRRPRRSRQSWRAGHPRASGLVGGRPFHNHLRRREGERAVSAYARAPEALVYPPLHRRVERADCARR